jgi:hypothetical protein
MGLKKLIAKYTIITLKKNKGNGGNPAKSTKEKQNKNL